MSNCILVLGTPRSGTSCVAGVLHHLGVPMGERLMPADEWNPAGYFQDEDFEDILHAGLGVWNFPNWDDIAALRDPQKTDGYGVTKTLRQTATAVRTLATSRSAKYPLWGVKSNRLAFFLPSLITGAGEVRIIRTIRPEAESIASWKARTEWADAEAAKPIQFMARAVDAGMQRANVTPALSVDYNGLVNDPASWVAQIAAVCGIPVTQAAIDFVNVDFRRFTNG